MPEQCRHGRKSSGPGTATASHHCAGECRIAAWRNFRKIAAIGYVLKSNAFSLRRIVNGTKHGQTGCETEPQLNKTQGVVT
jgi:hypothetical protein